MLGPKLVQLCSVRRHNLAGAVVSLGAGFVVPKVHPFPVSSVSTSCLWIRHELSATDPTPHLPDLAPDHEGHELTFWNCKPNKIIFLYSALVTAAEHSEREVTKAIPIWISSRCLCRPVVTQWTLTYPYHWRPMCQVMLRWVDLCETKHPRCLGTTADGARKVAVFFRAGVKNNAALHSYIIPRACSTLLSIQLGWYIFCCQGRKAWVQITTARIENLAEHMWNLSSGEVEKEGPPGLLAS